MKPITPALTTDYARTLLQGGFQPEYIRNYFQSADPIVKQEIEALFDKPAKATKIDPNEVLELLDSTLTKSFLVYRDISQTPHPLIKHPDNTVAEGSLEALRMVAARTIKDNYGKALTASKVNELVDTWLQTAPYTREMPKSFTLKPDVTAFNRISLTLEPGPTPVWDDFIRRCGVNGPSLQAYIWSIFEEDKHIQQYVMLKGEGQDGKGSLFRWIQDIVGDRAYTGISVNDEYWVAKCVGKRVAVWGDVNNTAFVLSADFKNFTGNDAVSVREKYKASYSASFDTKIFISTNHDLSLTSQKSELRRIIFCQIDEVSSLIPDYEAKLKAERAAILHKCHLSFNELYNDSEKRILCDMEHARESANEFETNFSSIFYNQLTVGANYRITREELYVEIKHQFKFRSEYSEFKNWLRRTHKIEEKKITDADGQRRNYYCGIALKHAKQA